MLSSERDLVDKLKLYPEVVSKCRQGEPYFPLSQSFSLLSKAISSDGSISKVLAKFCKIAWFSALKT